jgi:predicted RNA binding protein YcfA (HicA-like mRNA interferase family)/predicted RNase H-like HicB family nuclease
MSPRLPRETGEEVLRALRRLGWVEVWQTGSHRHQRHPERHGALVTVAAHAGRQLPVGKLASILDAAGLTGDELRELISGAVVLSYTELVEFYPEAKVYGVTVPASPGCTSMGDKLADALNNVREAVEGHLACLVELGEPIPEDTAPQAIRVDVAGLEAA